jgi:catechol 2,3-dioxygenase-like lactoylglutathione lyase family enzyme
MLDHVSITVSDIAAAERFYDAVTAALGVIKVGARADWLGYGERCRPEHPERSYISIRLGPKLEAAIGRHWCFKAPDRAAVDAFWAAGIAAGGSDDGAPGLRLNYHPAYYAAFLRDPDGNRVEAVCHHHLTP